ncbi:bifunctional molybdenum cofactor guanylyltransferase MobA/molybdopterin-guanine dinucleotide biosynthesis adaptor protein MobB [bacterium (Candidatus Blackallbacteria) CG17_big_fil_post_rev_8_21_14_2_50_48_46]|uniref:Probable molybdenum cofactor guanylyltransferase n=1 Tax=bacterium (Candidatus Blackallbacteria) CG17_big_fil_post_rev_8_21_14_2_50_48_46 TaxID=2014261 RepID=A0A2M7G0M1_9BACT|nr:MAG: bifunctional molybdenum cofactor guanylyltransferase MobA/molybdopterin-guanine dinucleotide biosynthesis adaptor protein MobB [bacterium (Candidatus Blackallbacteria) CG18_big_fil_WC_8_21_14_2_50_49_26]PIW15025.1 MAG: bifunctional molybdenum cofactor guanylyltransferase MobA/molybdopterin-guanine dinucleotide biosynthesis adaptor protein MobB [bacterium (Candidatus Blackallbacteria) CG17_big_fil_post_rev_8_21_14_2_50_48_46]PIW47652.1 MAG: bifunctional molybdenum cofactor guanylyltransfer
MIIKHQKTHQAEFFHPLTLAVCGLSHSGKTSLIKTLIAKYSKSFRVGYLKHDAHSFTMDTPGKDTFLAREAGAAKVLISNAHEQAALAPEPLDLLEKRQAFQNCDFLFVEGYKESNWPKWVFLDAQGIMLERVKSGEINQVLAYICEFKPPADLPVPAFCRSDIQAISEFFETWLGSQISNRPFNGLVLAGGMSQRMGQDKAALVYRDKTQLETSTELLASLCQQVYVSCRGEQKNSLQALTAFPVLEDRLLGLGPLGGILTAFLHQPEAAWLVLAVDLPWLDSATLQYLIQNRDPFALATAFRSSTDGLPEPLCAIYEPRFKERLFAFLGAGYQCPRKALLNSPIQYLELPEPHRLANANTPQDYEAIRREMADGNRSGTLLLGEKA